MNDLKFALRQLRKSPAFTSIAVITLALGIGLNTTIFSLINDLFLRGLPFKEPSRAVHMFAGDKSRNLVDIAISAPRFHQDAAAEDMLYERQRAPREVLEALKAMGHGVRAIESIGNVSAVGVYGERIFAVADPRHGGAAGGY